MINDKLTLLLVLTWMISLIVFYTPPIDSSGYIELDIRVILRNGLPLPNALVVVKPSMLSTESYENLTGLDGTTSIRCRYDTISNTVYIEIRYEPYGKIYSMHKVDVSNKTLTIRLDYEPINAQWNITDEYRRPLKITYELWYEEGGKRILVEDKKEQTNHILINGSDQRRGFFLLYNELNIEKYMLQLIDPNGTKYIFRLNEQLLKRNIVVLDEHPPKIDILGYKVKTTNLGSYTMLELSVTVRVRDGLNTNETSLDINYIYPEKKFGSTLTVKNITFIDGFPALIYIYNSSGIISSDEQYIVLNITASDTYSHHVFLEKIVYLVNRTTTTTYSSKTTTRLTSSPSTTTHGEKGSYSTSYFKPPTKQRGGGEDVDLYIVISPIISAGIIVYEVMRRRSR